MPTNTLTDAKIRLAKPAAKAQKLFDGGGLFLWLSPKGAKTWRCAYRFGGKQQTKGLGEYPLISLADARRLRDNLRRELLTGIDPMASRRSKAPGKTLGEYYRGYWHGRADVSERYRGHALSAFEQHVAPSLGGTKIDAIDKAMLLKPLLAMNDQRLFEYVRKVRGWLMPVFDRAIELGDASRNPAREIVPARAFNSQPVESFPSLELTEVPDFLKRLAMEPRILSVVACDLLARTWVRTDELRRAEVGEFDGDLWRIPAARMKMSRDHLVPLSAQALRLVEFAIEHNRGSKYLFPHEYRQDRPMSSNTILALIYRIGYKGRMSGHGWRSVASTWANESGYTPDSVERQLAHVPGDAVRAAYNRAEYLPERRKMLQDWANWLDDVIN